MNRNSRMKWSGWGAPGITVGLSEPLRRRLEAAFGSVDSNSATRPPDLPSARPVPLATPVATDDETRLRFSTGRSYLDLIRLRAPRLSDAVDAVASPQSIDEIELILRTKNIAIVPFGGGTSVVGGVAPLRGNHDAVIALDMTRLNAIEVDTKSMTVTAQAGVFGPDLEHVLNTHGLTLGHFPQSFEYSTVGGWIATRSAGQESTRYGRIEDLVNRVSAITPRGRFDAGHPPASATGPELRELFVGSEGAFGVIVDATLKVHPVPARRTYRSYLFRDFASGIEACRKLIQSAVRPAVMRLSDEVETQLSFDISNTPETLQRALRLAGRRPGAHLLLAFDDSHIPHVGGLPLGSSPGKHWARDRFRHPYLRDALIDRGYFIDTFETATTWSNLQHLYDALRATAPGIVACHVSHGYSDGASLYFTVIDKAQRGAEEAQWHEFKIRATDAIVKNGGTISHHHGIGVDHRRWLPQERGESGVGLLNAIKRELDPFAVMNPGKLL